ncbi:hypothetical protein JYU12_00475 [bacterium AH-315-K03]|nr:hypothetical protein [bacterium AH-315-K03]
MTKKYFFAICICALLLNGCAAPAKIKQLKHVNESKRATITIHRNSSFNAVLANVIVGIDGNDLAIMSTKQLLSLYIEEGNHKIYVRSEAADKPFYMDIAVNAGEAACYETYPNPSNLAKSLMPLSYYAGNTFKLKESTCLNEDEEQEYRRVYVQYADS